MFAERTPEESRTLLRTWRVGFLKGALVAAVAAALLFAWSTVAGAVVGVLAIILLVVWWRLHSQREAFEAMADAVGGGR
jgi:glucose uptake protein GlcU